MIYLSMLFNAKNVKVCKIFDHRKTKEKLERIVQNG